MLTEAQRHQLYSELSAVLSTEGATIIMDVVRSVTITELATKSDVAALGAATKSDVAALGAATKTDLTLLRAELKTDIADLRSELKTDMADLKSELKTDIADLKQDLTRTFVTLLFLSQGVLVSIVGLLLALA